MKNILKIPLLFVFAFFLCSCEQKNTPNSESTAPVLAKSETTKIPDKTYAQSLTEKEKDLNANFQKEADSELRKGWKKYTNKTYGLEFAYPDDYVVVDQKNEPEFKVDDYYANIDNPYRVSYERCKILPKKISEGMKYIEVSLQIEEKYKDRTVDKILDTSKLRFFRKIETKEYKIGKNGLVVKGALYKKIPFLEEDFGEPDEKSLLRNRKNYKDEYEKLNTEMYEVIVYKQNNEMVIVHIDVHNSTVEKNYAQSRDYFLTSLETGLEKEIFSKTAGKDTKPELLEDKPNSLMTFVTKKDDDGNEFYYTWQPEKANVDLIFYNAKAKQSWKIGSSVYVAEDEYERGIIPPPLTVHDGIATFIEVYVNPYYRYPDNYKEMSPEELLINQQESAIHIVKRFDPQKNSVVELYRIPRYGTMSYTSVYGEQYHSNFGFPDNMVLSGDGKYIAYATEKVEWVDIGDEYKSIKRDLHIIDLENAKDTVAYSEIFDVKEYTPCDPEKGVCSIPHEAYNKRPVAFSSDDSKIYLQGIDFWQEEVNAGLFVLDLKNKNQKLEILFDGEMSMTPFLSDDGSMLATIATWYDNGDDYKALALGRKGSMMKGRLVLKNPDEAVDNSILKNSPPSQKIQKEIAEVVVIDIESKKVVHHKEHFIWDVTNEDYYSYDPYVIKPRFINRNNIFLLTEGESLIINIPTGESFNVTDKLREVDGYLTNKELAEMVGRLP